MYDQPYTRKLAQSPSGSQAALLQGRNNSFENLHSPTNIVNPETADIYTSNMQSH